MLGCMEARTIVIDRESHDPLAASKRPGESFSDVIKRVLQAERHTAAHLLDHLDDVLLAVDTIAAIQAVVDERRRS